MCELGGSAGAVVAVREDRPDALRVGAVEANRDWATTVDRHGAESPAGAGAHCGYGYSFGGSCITDGPGNGRASHVGVRKHSPSNHGSSPGKHGSSSSVLG